MKEVTGNLWDYPADVRVITTNGSIKTDGTCVMGRGCAFEAKGKFPSIPRTLGLAIEANGNVVNYLGSFPGIGALFSFPVKHKWYENADPVLIKQSAEDLVDAIADYTGDDEDIVVVMPRPGCGNGKLRWEDVKKILEPILDDRFHIITFK